MLAAVRSNTLDKQRISWILYGHTNNEDPQHITLVGKDISQEAKLEDFVQMLEDKSVMYGLVRVSSMVADVLTVKFVYIRW